MNRRRPGEGHPRKLGVFNINTESPEVPPLLDPEQLTPDEGAGINPYCTHECLLGVAEGLNGKLDTSCPNWRAHGASKKSGTHRLDGDILRAHLTQQILEDRSSLRLTKHCSSNAIIAQVRPKYYGYTVIAKGMNIFMAEERRKRREEDNLPYYDDLWDAQGETLPVYLGTIRFYNHVDEDDIYQLELFSFAGQPLTEHLTDQNRGDMRRAMENCVKAIEAGGIVIDDMCPEDFVWDESRQQIMLINLLNAKFRPRPRKYNRGMSAPSLRPPKEGSDSASEDGSYDSQDPDSEATETESRDGEDFNPDHADSEDSEDEDEDIATGSSLQRRNGKKRPSPEDLEENSHKRMKTEVILPFRAKD